MRTSQGVTAPHSRLACLLAEAASKPNICAAAVQNSAFKVFMMSGMFLVCNGQQHSRVTLAVTHQLTATTAVQVAFLSKSGFWVESACSSSIRGPGPDQVKTKVAQTNHQCVDTVHSNGVSITGWHILQCTSVPGKFKDLCT